MLNSISSHQKQQEFSNEKSFYINIRYWIYSSCRKILDNFIQLFNKSTFFSHFENELNNWSETFAYFFFNEIITIIFLVRKFYLIFLDFIDKMNVYFLFLRWFQYSMSLKFLIRHFFTIDLKMNCSIISQTFFNIFNNVYIFIASQNCSICW